MTDGSKKGHVDMAFFEPSVMGGGGGALINRVKQVHSLTALINRVKQVHSLTFAKKSR